GGPTATVTATPQCIEAFRPCRSIATGGGCCSGICAPGGGGQGPICMPLTPPPTASQTPTASETPGGPTRTATATPTATGTCMQNGEFCQGLPGPNPSCCSGFCGTQPKQCRVCTQDADCGGGQVCDRSLN